MPWLHNPTEYRLAYDSTGALIGPGESVEITDEQAEAFENRCVFVVERSKPSSSPERKTVKRGSKRVEVSIAPEPETRAKGLTTGDFFPK